MNRIAKFLALTLAAVWLAGCMPRVDFPQTEAALPSVRTTDIPAAPERFEKASRQAEALLWYPTETGDRLTFEEAAVTGGSESELYAAALKAMARLSAARFPEKARLAGVECAGSKLAVAEWTVPEGTGERALFELLAASANTLGSLGAEAVCFRVNGSPARILGWPVGAMAHGDGDLTAMWARLQLESEQEECVRRALIYRAALDGGSVSPELGEVRLTRGDEAAALTDALRGECRLPGLYAAFPADSGALRGGIQTSGDGILSLTMDANLLAMLENEAIRPWQMYAATACTLLAFLPDARGVEIRVGSARVGRMDTGSRQITFENGAMRWDDFTDVRSCRAMICLPAGDGLVAAPRFLRPSEDASPEVCLSLLLTGRENWEGDGFDAMPSGLSVDEDILGLALDGEEARVNLAPSFREKCAALTASQERCLVYAMVNTLCGIRDIRRVRFYIGGEPAEIFVREISFLSPLVYNEGLLRQGEAE